MQLRIRRVITVRTLKDLIAGVCSKEKARVGKGSQLPLNGANADIDNAGYLTNEESLVWRAIQGA